MANTPEDLTDTKDHEWVRVKGEEATIGITDHAQRQLGTVVYVELPKVGDKFEVDALLTSISRPRADHPNTGRSVRCDTTCCKPVSRFPPSKEITTSRPGWALCTLNVPPCASAI